MHSSFAWGFWWLNVVICGYCILYWALKRFPDGTPALLTTTGQIWVWQLAFAFALLAMGGSPWHLLWLAPVSVVMSIIVQRLVYNLRMNRLIRTLEAQDPDYFKVAAPAQVLLRPKTASSDAKKQKRAGQISELEVLRRESRERGKSEVACKAGALLDSDAKRDILYDSLGEHPALAAKLRHYWPYLVRSNMKPTPLKVSLMFNNMAVKLVEEGEPFVGLKSIECSLLFDGGGPDHWVAQAEVFCALKDRSAARYASAVIEYQDARDAATKAGLQFPHYVNHKVLRGEYMRMLEIIQICNGHTEWVDSHTFVEQSGIFNS
jgi:hypothetical protein